MVITSRYDGKCIKCGQWFRAGSQVEWNRGIKGAAHTECPPISAAVLQASNVALSEPVVLNLQPIYAFIDAARARGLKRPAARFLAPGNEEMRLYISGSRSSFPNTLQVLVRDQWLGRVFANGEVHGGKLKDDGPLQDTLRAIAQDPVSAAKAYGALMGACSFCSKSLTDEGSVEVGYGPVCAKHYGLPHTSKGVRELGQVPVIQ